MQISRKASRRILWLALLFTVPIPFYLGGFEVAPPVRVVFLTGLVVAVVATEGAAGYQGTFTLLGVVQSVLWLALFYGVAAAIARMIQRGVGEGGRVWAVGALVVALFALSLFEIYRTPLSSVSLHSNVAGLFD